MRQSESVHLILEARRAEKEQALFYRALAAAAEDAGDAQMSEDMNGLHADEQHHLSRLTVRLLELDVEPGDLDDVTAPAVDLGEWRTIARERETAEVARYEELLRHPLTPETAALVEQILVAERAHERTLGGKHMDA